jgi:riboflavin synthase
MKTIGVVDTTFARGDLGAAAVRVLKGLDVDLRIVRSTVPGIKDLPVGSLKMFRDEKADIVMALGMPGKAEYDKVCAHEASTGLMDVAIKEGKPIVEVFVFEGEAIDDKQLHLLARKRAEEHALNAYLMACHPEKLSEKAGTGARQGFTDAGPVGTHRHKTRRNSNAFAKYA